MTPLTRLPIAAAVAALMTAWTTIDLPSINWGTPAAIWGVLTAVMLGGWAVIVDELKADQ